MTVHHEARPSPEPQQPERHHVSEEQDVSLMLRAGVEQTAASSLAHLLLLRHAQHDGQLPPDILAAMRRVQERNRDTMEPNRFTDAAQELRRPRVSGDGASS